MRIKFYVPGEACAQGRPRFTSFTTKAGNTLTHAYDPAKSRNYKAFVKQIAMYEAERQGWKYNEMPLSVSVVADIVVPASKSKKFREAALAHREWPTKKPDVDNIFKGIADSVSGILYKDDKQIIASSVKKQYAEQPGVWVVISTEVE